MLLLLVCSSESCVSSVGDAGGSHLFSGGCWDVHQNGPCHDWGGTSLNRLCPQNLCPY